MAYNQNYSQRNNRDEVHYDLMERIGVLGTKDNGWTKEVNIVSWNGGKAKVDIRDWDPDHERMTKGITLFDNEAENLVKVLAGRYGLRFANAGRTSAASAASAPANAPSGTSSAPPASRAYASASAVGEDGCDDLSENIPFDGPSFADGSSEDTQAEDASEFEETSAGTYEDPETPDETPDETPAAADET